MIDQKKLLKNMDKLDEHIEAIENEREQLINLLFECKQHIEWREDFLIEDCENGEDNLYAKLLRFYNNYKPIDLDKTK